MDNTNETNRIPGTNETQEMTPKQMIDAMYPARYRVVRSVLIELVSGYILRKVGQAYMVMPTGPRMKDYQGMITLNETGAFLFKEMQKPERTEENLAEACMQEYGATKEEADKAVELFIQQCGECGLMNYQEVIFDARENKVIDEEEIDPQWVENEEKERAELLEKYMKTYKDKPSGDAK